MLNISHWKHKASVIPLYMLNISHWKHKASVIPLYMLNISHWKHKASVIPLYMLNISHWTHKVPSGVKLGMNLPEYQDLFMEVFFSINWCVCPDVLTCLYWCSDVSVLMFWRVCTGVLHGSCITVCWIIHCVMLIKYWKLNYTILFHFYMHEKRRKRTETRDVGKTFMPPFAEHLQPHKKVCFELGLSVTFKGLSPNPR